MREREADFMMQKFRKFIEREKLDQGKKLNGAWHTRVTRSTPTTSLCALFECEFSIDDDAGQTADSW